MFSFANENKNRRTGNDDVDSLTALNWDMVNLTLRDSSTIR